MEVWGWYQDTVNDMGVLGTKMDNYQSRVVVWGFIYIKMWSYAGGRRITKNIQHHSGGGGGGLSVKVLWNEVSNNGTGYFVG